MKNYHRPHLLQTVTPTATRQLPTIDNRNSVKRKDVNRYEFLKKVQRLSILVGIFFGPNKMVYQLAYHE